MADSLLKCVKRGKADEQTLAAECIRLLAIQLGMDLAPLYSDIQSVLSTLLADNSASVQTRAQVKFETGFYCPVLQSLLLSSMTLTVVQER